MAQHSSRWISHQVRSVRQRFQQASGLPFQDVLCSEAVTEVMAEMGVHFRDCVYGPPLTIWMFLSQVLSSDHSCREAVFRARTHLIACEKQPCSPDTSPYCKSRQRLPEELVHQLACRIGADLHASRPGCELLKGRPIKIADGSTVSMPDTPANQNAYPQPSSQQAGLGFPVARIVALIGWATGALLDVAVGPCVGKESGESALLRDVFERLDAGDILVADRYYGSFFMIALLQRLGVDCVFPLHQLRDYDFRRGRRLGPDDHVVTWLKPIRPQWLDQELYDRIPQTLEIRELRIQSCDPTTRPDELILVTTLLEPEVYPQHEISQVYGFRWDSETDLCSIKSQMQMDILRCKSPGMVRKEIWMHMLGYNLIRTVICEAGQQHELMPREISFKGTLQALNALRSTLVLADPSMIPNLYQELLRTIASQLVRNRPGRVEPRAIKRRVQKLPLLTEPRELARRRCPAKS